MRLFFALLLSTLLVAKTAGLTEEEILIEREKRVRHLEEALQSLEEQMDRHLSGEKVLPDDRLSSLSKRINVYEDQLMEASRELSDEEIQEILDKSEL